MRILFYSETCNFCLKLLEYINKNNLAEFFKMICIDKTNNIPKNITVVPTVIDTIIQAPLEGKKAFEYVINQKYFNHPTNNIDYIKYGVPKPTIEEDHKAISAKSSSGFIYVDKDTEKKYIDHENNFEQLFNKSIIHGEASSNNNLGSSRITQNVQKPPSDDRVNELINSRNIQDKKLATLMRLRR